MPISAGREKSVPGEVGREGFVHIDQSTAAMDEQKGRRGNVGRKRNDVGDVASTRDCQVHGLKMGVLCSLRYFLSGQRIMP